MEVDLASTDLERAPAGAERDGGHAERACVEVTGHGNIPHRKDDVVNPVEVHPVSSVRRDARLEAKSVPLLRGVPM